MRGFPCLASCAARPPAHSWDLSPFFALFSIFGDSRNFLSVAGVTPWMNYASLVGMIAIPAGFLMIAGELDISTGAVLPASTMTVAIVSEGRAGRRF